MEKHSNNSVSLKAPLLNDRKAKRHARSIPSSSPALNTPTHPIRTSKSQQVSRLSILPISLPPATLRPLAFRTFTKKHNLNLTSSALQIFATFIGKYCGSGWREEGLAEKVLDEAARMWKKNGGGLLVEGDGDDLNSILRTLETTMDAGRPFQNVLRRHASFVFSDQQDKGQPRSKSTANSLIRADGIDVSALELEDDQTHNESHDPRRWLRIVNAFEQPRLRYNVNQKHFEIVPAAPSLFADPSQKTYMFRQRYHLTHQRLLRNDSFQTSVVALARQAPTSRGKVDQPYKLTPIANLLGRGGSSHMLLGLLTKSPSGLLMINDLTGSISLDIQHAHPSPEDGVWFTPGMMAVVDGQYEDAESRAGAGLDGNEGVGGTVGGVFVVFGMTGPPCERRETTIGVDASNENGTRVSGAGFGWVDFLGIGSERAVGSSLRKLESQILRKYSSDPSGGRTRVVLLGEVSLDNAKSLQALKRVLAMYAAEPASQTPMAIVLMGNFVHYAVMAGGGSGGSIEYKECFDSLASVLSEYPSMLQNTTFVFVPGDNDPWSSTFSAGAAPTIPRGGVPDLFTSRVRRTFADAKIESEKATGRKLNGEAVWSTNPTRLTLFGSVQEIVIFRDNMSSRLRRNALRFGNGSESSALDSESSMLRKDNRNGSDQLQTDEVASFDAAAKLAASNVPAQQQTNRSHDQISPETVTCRKLVKTILDQGHLAPFPSTQRPVLWDYASSLQLYPLPTALVLMDPEAPAFAVGLDGCHVMNPGPIIPPGKKNTARWMEYNVRTRRGKVREIWY